MKKFTMFSNYLLLLIAAAVLGLTACGDDPILGTEIPPSVSINGDVEVAPEGVITLTISGSKGDADMNLLSIKEDGVTISLDPSLVNNDIGSGDALLTGANSADFDFTVEVRAPSVPGLYTYSATVTDVNGKTDEASVDVVVSSTPPTITYAGTNPREVTLVGGNGFNISATRGSSDLTTIAVYEDGVLMNPTRLKFNNVDFGTNPYDLVGDDLQGFSMASVTVTFSEAGTSNLTFEVGDANGETASTEVSVVAGTVITTEFSAVLLSNAEGMDVLGGLDLDAGMNVSVNSSLAEVIDLGIVSNTDPTWIQKIQGANGAILKAADPAQAELFNFANINSREAIIAAFDSGIDAAPSNKVEVGDVFIVKRENNYYIMSTVEVVITPAGTPQSNEDFYRFDIKNSLQ